MRGFTDTELANATVLTNLGINFGVIFTTTVGLEKGILDATAPFRQFLSIAGVHDFESQNQGPESKVLIQGRVWLTDHLSTSRQVSLYRPTTKKGDPRLWVGRLNQIADAGSCIAFIWNQGNFEVWNLAKIDLSAANPAPNSLPAELTRLGKFKTGAREELTEKLCEIAARGWTRALRPGSTAVGHLLEDVLGIAPNSSKAPDFKGIELKASASTSRVNLFAKVPNWAISECKSSQEIAQLYGYDRGNERRLYCTVKVGQPNSQALQFEIIDGGKTLSEIHTAKTASNVAKWLIPELIVELQAKHRETFWVKAQRQVRPDGIYFKYKAVLNTKNPVIAQFVPLLEQQHITMDHLIKIEAGKSAKEKGPLFKINPNVRHLLFPQPTFINLETGDKTPY
jgi:hypothetical protein